MILSNYAIKFRTAVFVFIIVLVLAGISAYLRLPREGSPDITIPYVFITSIYEGTAPTEIEQLITIPLEKQLNDLENVKEITSTSAESVSSVAIEFLPTQDIDLALQKVKNKIDLARPDLPDDLDEPVAQAINFSTDFPILIFALAGDTDPRRLKNLAETLQDQIEEISGVKEAAITGTREREIRVEVDLPKLITYDISLPLLMQRIASENSTISAGNLEMKNNKFQIRVPGEFERVGEISQILLVERDGHPIYLSDIATISDTYKDRESISRLNGQPSVSVQVKKRNRENTVAIIEQVKGVLNDFELPPGITLTIVMDEADYIDMMIRELENNIVSGFLLVLIALLIFMGGRNSLFVALAIPFSMLITFIVISALGLTLNMIVLFSLVLSVGMLVDNAIVIVENIYRNRTLGLTRKEAARRGAAEVAWPVITSTMTTLAAFSPLLFWPDIMGQFMSFLPKTLIITLSASLFVAIIINPAVCSAFISSGKGKPTAKPSHHPFVTGYEVILRWALRYRVPIMLLSFAILILTVLLYAHYGKGQELFPDVEPRNATVDVKFPEGTGIDHTDAVLRDIEKKISTVDDIKFCLTGIGSGAAGSVREGSGGSGTHRGNVHAEFVKIDKRRGDTREHIAEIRDVIGSIPGAEIKVEKQQEGPPLGAPVSIELSGDDFDTLSRYAGTIIQQIKSVPGLVDVQDDLEEALPEIQFQVNRHHAALLGLDTDTIGTFLRMSIYGLEASKFRADEDEYDITLRLPQNQRNTVALLDEISIPLPGGKTVPLSSLGEPVYTAGRGAIKRKDQKRVITISGNNQGRGVDEILAEVAPLIDGINLPRGYNVKYAGDNQEMAESSAFLARAFLIAVSLIIVILVIQFNSAVLPFIIVVSVVLSLIGVMWGLLICRMRFSIIMTGLGVISLAGIVVNNAIVLVDCIRQREAEGQSVTEAIVSGGRLRLRPVLLTALTTVLGLIPMAVGYSLDVHTWPPTLIAGAESSLWWAPMAVAVIFGLTLATVLTLVLVPVMYSLAHSMISAFKQILSLEE